MTVLRERIGAIEVVTISRPEARNAIDLDTHRQLTATFDELDADEEIKSVVLTGAGTEAFSAGVDLKAVAAMESEEEFRKGGGGFAGITERKLSKPIIAAINGYAIGGGLEITLACDLVVAAEHAYFSSPEVRLGILADGGSIIRLPHWVPLPIAKEILLLGERMTARRAYEVGLVNRVVASDQVRPTAIRIAQKIAGLAPISVRLTKELLQRALNVTEGEAWELNRHYIELINRTEDHHEGARAFNEKRAAVFRGR